MKTILFPTEQKAPMETGIAVRAVCLLEKFGGRIESFALRPAVELEMVAMDPDAGITMVAVKENDADMVRQAEEFVQRCSCSVAACRSDPLKLQGASAAPVATVVWGWRATPRAATICRQLRPRL